eukprot:3267900-Rhodomonas_salina.3
MLLPEQEPHQVLLPTPCYALSGTDLARAICTSLKLSNNRVGDEGASALIDAGTPSPPSPTP